LLTEPSVVVSHTVHDLVFIWNDTDPLVVNPDIELPQLDISNNYTADCTIEYSTGMSLFSYLKLHVHGKELNTEGLHIMLSAEFLVGSLKEATG
jgi:hypothetical protein